MFNALAQRMRPNPRLAMPPVTGTLVQIAYTMFDGDYGRNEIIVN
jgi:hypothetical protein